MFIMTLHNVFLEFIFNKSDGKLWYNFIIRRNMLYVSDNIIIQYKIVEGTIVDSYKTIIDYSFYRIFDNGIMII